MADNKEAIKILFDVAGGGSIDGETGKLISENLRKIADQIKLDVRVNEKTFSAEVEKLKKELQSKLGTLEVQFKTKQAKESSGKTSRGVSGDDAELQKFKEAKKYLAEREKLQRKINKLTAEGQTEVEAVYKGKFKELLPAGQKKLYSEELKDQLKNAKEKFEAASGAAGEYTQRLKDLAEESEKVTEKQTRLAAADTPKQLESAKLGFDGVTANIKSLGERYSDLIKNNKEARLEWEKLKELAEEPWRGDNAWTTVDKEGNVTEHVASLAAGKKQTQELAAAMKNAAGRFSELTKESDTFGHSIRQSFSTKLVQYFAAIMSGIVTAALSKVLKNVIELDTAVTNLQIATGKSRKETKELVKTYAELATQLGATVTEVTDAADTWLRQGYDVSETNELITNTLMLSKLGQIDSAEAAKALTSAMKGYKVEVKDASKIVDKFTAVDMEAAVSAGDIATAMAETATGADIAGVSMDKLIGYIATVAEVTQDGAESVGTFYKTLFARMGNVKAGKFTDDETGESLNDVESTLDKVGIKLRDESGQFRNFGDVLDEVGAKWGTYTSVQQHAIATAMAGTRQQEKLITLFENYGNAIDYASIAANSAGTATEKYQTAYLDSIDAQLNRIKAAWQKFSTSILDSDLVKGGAKLLADVVKLLNNIVNIGNGAVGELTLMIGAFTTLAGLLVTLAKSTVFMNIAAGFKSVTSTVGLMVRGVQLLVANTKALIATSKLSSATILEQATAQRAAAAASVKASAALKSVSVTGWATLTAVTIYGIVKVIQKAANAATKAAEAAKQNAEQKLEDAQEAASNAAKIWDLISEYQELIGKETDLSTVDSDTRQKLLEIQGEINKLTSGEIDNISLINGGYDEKLKKLKEIYNLETKSAAIDAMGAYRAAKEATESASEKSNVSVDWVSLLGKGSFKLQRGKEVGENGDKIASLLQEVGGFHVNSGVSLKGDKYYWVDTDFTNARDMVEKLGTAIQMAQERGIDYGINYEALVDLQKKYQAYIDSEKEAASAAVDSIISWMGSEESFTIESLEDYKKVKAKLISDALGNADIKEMLSEGAITPEDVVAAIDTWFSQFYKEWFDKSKESEGKTGGVLESYLEILKKLEEPFDTLKSTLDDITESGVASANSISALLEKYPELEKYFKMTDKGYVMADGYEGMSTGDILRDYVNNELKAYEEALANCTEGTKEWEVAQENLNNARAVGATLLRTTEIEEWEKKLEDQKDALEEQLDKYKSVIDIRKDLLNSYKEEIDYRKELQKKENSVADLETELSVARLDKSAAGQARVRELEQQLDDAQEELDTFTLEHAVDKITSELDSEYGQYEKFINAQVDKITKAIDEVGKTTDYTETGELLQGTKESFQQDTATKSSATESFERILRNVKIRSPESLITTPGALREANRDIVNNVNSSVTSNGVQYNAPIIEINCGSVTKESLPELKKTAQETADSLIRNGISRTGYKAPVKSMR